MFGLLKVQHLHYEITNLNILQLFGTGSVTSISNVQSSHHHGAPPKSPARTIVRAHLGDHGHTFVPTKPGITVRDALSKAMKLRKLVPETCAVYRFSDPSKVKTKFISNIIEKINNKISMVFNKIAI